MIRIDEWESTSRRPAPPGFGAERPEVVVRLFQGLEAFGMELFAGATSAEIALAVTWFAGGWVAHHAHGEGMSRKEAIEMAAGLIAGVTEYEMTPRNVGHA